MKKLNKEQVEEIKKLYLEGKSQIELSRLFQVSQLTIKYHVDEKHRAYLKEYQTRRLKNLTPEKRKEQYLKKKEYLKGYYKTRYKNDEVFREKEKRRHRKCV